MKKQLDFNITSNIKLNNKTNLLKVTPSDGSILPKILPGQFVQLLVENSSNIFLRRPISINFVDKDRNEVWLLIQKIGKGTNQIASMRVNETINLLFPLGNSFSIPLEKKEVLLVGGGVGTAPLLWLGKVLKDKGFTPNFLLGGRSAEDITQLDVFEAIGNVFITTEDATLGEKGFVIHHSILIDKKFDSIYTCGPKPMMIAIAQYAKEKNINCEASLENHMPCGFGVCLCCVEKTKHGNICVCTEGPIFNIDELRWIN